MGKKKIKSIGKSILNRKSAVSPYKLTKKDTELMKEAKRLVEEQRQEFEEQRLPTTSMPEEASDDKLYEEKRGLATILSPLEMPDKNEQIKKNFEKRLERRKKVIPHYVPWWKQKKEKEQYQPE